MCLTCCRMADKTPPTELSLHVKMFILADKYQVTGLMDRATSKFEAACDRHWDNAEQVNKAAWMALHMVREGEPRLQNVLARTINSHGLLLRSTKVKEMLRDFKGLTMQVMEEKDKEYHWPL
jgi:hypothetical protein